LESERLKERERLEERERLGRRRLERELLERELLERERLERELIEPTDDTTKFDRAVATLVGRGVAIPRPEGNVNPPRRAVPNSDRVVRDPKVAAFVRLRANGKCEVCECDAPFYTEKNTPFLEVHHLDRLAENGPDTVENAIAVCPNCHRRLHHGRERDRIKSELLAKRSLNA
jgi:5-methylcytosine-specific restriction protein A